MKYFITLVLLITTACPTSLKAVSTLTRLCSSTIAGLILKEQNENNNTLLTHAKQILPDRCKQSLAAAVLNKPLAHKSSTLQQTLLSLLSVTLEKLSGHCIRCACFSPDGQLLVSASFDKTIKIWDTTNYACTNTLTNPQWIDCICFSPNSKLFASGSYKEIKLWETTNYTCIKTLTDHNNWVNCVCFSPNGKLFASSAYQEVKLWNTTNYTCTKTLTDNHTDSRVCCLSFKPDSQLLVKISKNNIISWKITDDTCCIKTFTDQDWVSCICLSPNDELLTSCNGTTIKIYNTTDYTCIQTITDHDDNRCFYFACLSSNNQLLFSTYTPGIVYNSRPTYLLDPVLLNKVNNCDLPTALALYKLVRNENDNTTLPEKIKNLLNPQPSNNNAYH